MYALNGSFVYNYGTESIETWGAWSHGMVANVGSYAYNDGSIITHGGNAYGMAAVGLSSADNYGDIVTGGSDSYGMLAWDSSEALNAGSITTTGDNAWGMLLIEGSTGTNNGTITTTGIDSHAVRLDDSDFINTGTLDSAQGFAVAASNNSNVTLLDDTVLAGSRVLADLDGTYDGRDSLSGTSTLTVDMDADIDAVVAGFGEFTKRGDGTMLIEAGSWAGDTRHEAGMLKIEGMTQFVTETYDQEEGARLYLYANPFSATDPDAIPLWVSGDAWMDGSMRADMTSATGVGFYNFIRATYYEGEPVTTFENLDPLFLAYGPAWVDGWDNDYHYRTLLGYSFSEAALGLVAAVDDWNMLRWIMGNHLQDVAESMKEMEVGEKKIHAHALGGTTSRDPADSASAGFDSTQKGISVGFDKKSNDNTVWGLYAGYTEKDIDFTGLPMVGSDWESQDTWHIGGYISKKWDRWIFSNTLTFRSTDHKTFRVQMGGDATASFDSWAITNDLRLGYVAKEIGEGSNWQVIPEVGLNVGYFDRGGYTEKNGFTYGDFDTTVVESVLGVRFRGEYERANGSKFVPQARLAWVHVLSGGDITIDQSWGGTTHWFTEYLDDDYFVADLGLSLYNMNDMDISLNYGGRFSDNSTTHGGWLRLEWRF
jgi:outer membrane autotransporter protein